MKVSFLTHPTDQDPQPTEVDGLEGLGDVLSEFATAEKGSTAWIAGEAHGRTDAHVQSVNFWVLDFDGTEPPWDKLAGWRYIAHTSHSHMKVTPSHPEPVPCWRVIVELDSPGVPSDWKMQYKAKALMHDLKVSTDGKTCNPGRIWYVPSPDSEWRANLDGAPAAMPAIEACKEQVEREDLSANDDGLLSDGALFWPQVERMMLTIPPSISGAGGDDRLFEAACICRSSFRLTPDACMKALEIFNSRCKPPWDEARLWHKVQQAAGDRMHAPGELIPATARAALKAASGVPEILPPAPVGPSQSPFRLISAAQLAEPLGPVDWLVRDLGIAPGRPCVFQGYAGSGKTVAAQEIALSVASGQAAFMGKMHVRQGTVLHIDVDQGRRATASRYQQLAQGRGLYLAGLPIDLVVFEGYLTAGREVSPEAVQKLANACEGRSLCIIDSLKGISPGMDENSSDISGVLQALASITDATEHQCGVACTFLVIHHEGKPVAGNGRQAKHAGRGSSAIQDRSGAVWRLVQDEETREVEWTMSKISEHDTEFGKPFRTKLLRGDDSFTLSASAVESKVNQARANVEHVGAKLFARLRDSDRWLTRGELLTDVMGSTRDKVDALCLLRERKQLAYRVSGSQHQYHWNPKIVD